MATQIQFKRGSMMGKINLAQTLGLGKYEPIFVQILL